MLAVVRYPPVTGHALGEYSALPCRLLAAVIYIWIIFIKVILIYFCKITFLPMLGEESL